MIGEALELDEATSAASASLAKPSYCGSSAGAPLASDDEDLTTIASSVKDNSPPLFQDDNPLYSCPSVDGEDREFSWSSPSSSAAAVTAASPTLTAADSTDSGNASAVGSPAAADQNQPLLPTSCSTETLKVSVDAATCSTPILRKVGDKTPPGTLKKREPTQQPSSCKEWCEQYSQAFLSNVIDTPVTHNDEVVEDESSTNTA